MSVPSRPSDQTIQNIGFYYKAPTDNNLYKINNDLANQTYASDCQTFSTNGDVPAPRFEIDTYSDNVTEDNLIFADDDGTVRRYFIHGDEEVSDYYCENKPISDSEYQSLSADAKEFYCDKVGGKITSVNISNAGNQLDSSSATNVYEKSTSGTGAVFTPIISNPSFSAGLNNISNHDLAQVSQIITDVSDLDGVDYSLTPLYDFPSLSGQERAAIREKCRYFIRDIYYRYLGREVDESGLNYYGNKIYDIFVSCAFGDCKYWRVNELVVDGIRNSPEGLQYQERLKAGTVKKPEYVMPTFGSYTQPEKWKRLFGNDFFSDSFRASGGGKLIEVKIDQGGSGYRVGDTFGVSQTNNSSATDAEFKITNIDSSGSDRFLKQPTCTVVREISRPVGVEIWNAPDADPGDTTDCPTNGSFINKAIVEGTVGGTVFGSGPYASSSDIATAAVHAGLITPGQIAEIAWYSASSNLIANFSGSTKNGITSYSSDTVVSGVIISLEVTTAGNLSDGTTTVKPKQVNGSGAVINIQINASFNVVSASVITGGNSYKVGDTFEVVSSSDGVNENPAILTVTEVKDVTVSGSCGINLKLNRIISSDDDVCENPQEILTLVVDSDNPESNLRYLVEKEIGLTYVDTSRDRIIDQVQDIDGSGSSDDVLSESANLTLNLFMEKISRLPSVVEFQQYIRLYYGVGAVQTDEIINQFYVQFEDELDVPNQVTSVTSKCDRLNVSPPPPEDNGDDNCVYDRRSFFNPGVHGTSLKSLWEFLGRPANQNSGQDNEPDMSDFAGMTLQRWKPCGYHTSDSNFGGMVLDVVPYQGQSSNYSCSNETLTTDLAIYNVSSRVLYNNGSQVITNLVSETTDPDAIKINQKYLEKLQRPAEQAGMEYWWEAANNRQETDLAIYITGQVILEDGTIKSGYYVETIKNTSSYDILTDINNEYNRLFFRPAEQAGLEYWYNQYVTLYSTYQTDDAVYNRNTRIEYQDGFVVVKSTVARPLTQNARLINDKYVNRLGRPAEKDGLVYWLKRADEVDIDVVLNEIDSAAVVEDERGGIKSITIGVDRVLDHIRHIAENEPNAIPAGIDPNTNEYKVYLGVDKILRDIEIASATELERGEVKSIQLKCEYQPQGAAGAIDLSWFTNTRLPPWWGTLSLAPPVLSNASTTDDIIYLINSPSDQTEIYKGFSEDDNTSNPKNQFELKFVVNWPVMTGEVGAGSTKPTYRKMIDITWYKQIPGQTPEPRARVQYSNVPNLEPQGFQNGVVTSYPDTPSLEILNSNQSEFVTTLTVEQLQDDSNISKQDALEISYDELPNSGTYYYAKVTVENKPIDQTSGTFIPGVGGSNIKQNDSPATACKFLTNEEIQTQTCWNGDVIPVTSTCPPQPPQPPICPNGEKVCSNGETKCIEDDCPPVTPQNCNSLSVSCGSSQKINVFTNSDTSITFSYRVNNASKCSEKGTAKVSIRRYWPCGIFGVARDFANVWLVQKKTVSIVNGVAEYTLKVNTARDDYLQGADCHWIYVAYWEIDHSKIDCRFDAWDNPGCDYDDGSDTLEEILCIQQQTCTGKGSSITNVDRGKVTSYEILNPYPDPRLKNFINSRDFAGFGEFNPATVDGNNWNWYYDCVPRLNLFDREGDLIPDEGFEAVTITGSGSGFNPALQFSTFQNSTRGPDGDVTMTKGCRDSSNDFVQWYVGAKSKLQDIPGIFDQGDGYAVGDIVEFRALDQDPETVPVRIRITQIQPSLITAQCGTECPICEQSIEVVISDTTECGPVDFPRMIENNAAPGGLVNNGAFGIGGGTDIVWFTIPNDYPIILGKDQAKIKTDSRGNQYLDVRLWAEVLIQSAVVGDQLTSGRYNAVQFSGVDYSSVISNCCGDNPPGAGSFECNNFVSSGGCLEDNSENSLQVECNAEVRVVAHWYYKRTDANGAQDAGYIPFLNYNEDGVAVSQVPEDYYPVSAGNNPSAMFMSYDSEESYKNGLHKASLFRGGQIARKLYYPNDVKSVEIFLELKSSNDEWGKEIYHPPPRGWNERDFGTTTQVSSLRAPWLIQGQAAYGPKDRIFSVGKFGISDVLELPTVDWIARIDGCADAQVYAPLDYLQGGTYLCGDKNSPNWYQCEYSMFGKNSVANETWRLNGEDGTSNGGPAFYGEVCAPELVGFPDCLPKTDVVLKANTQDGSGLFTINWKDIPVPSECAQGLKLLWYIDGVCVTPGQSNDIFKPYKLLSCGPSEAEIDLSANMTNPNKSYEVECIIVLNNGLYVANKNVNFNWTTQNGDDYNYSDREDWAVKRSTRRQPININQDIRSGDFYQIIVSRAGCKVKGNDGPGEPPPYVAPPTNPSISIELSVNGPTTVELDNGQVTMEFTARIQYDQGGYYPSDAPNLFTYGIAVSQEFTYNTEFTWTETFTNANTYEIPVQINKNFCPPGVGTTDECDGRIFVTAKATVLVTIEAESVPPTVTPQPAEYSTNDEDGCGLSVNGKDVTITQTILITQGTGKYEWDDVQVSAQGWNHYDQGSKLIRTFTINHATNDDKVTGGKVIFYKNNQEVYSEFTGPMTYCVNAISIPTATAVAATYSREQNGCGLILDGVPVEIYQNIEITQGTGQYEWDEVTTTSGDYRRDGTTLTQTITRSRTSNGQYGTTVIFLKDGSEVHREGSGANTWCTIVSNSSPPESDPNPSNPGNSDTNEK